MAPAKDKVEKKMTNFHKGNIYRHENFLESRMIAFISFFNTHFGALGSSFVL